MSVEATVSPPARPSERPHHPVRTLLLAGRPRFVRISLAWAGYLFLASTVRLLVLRLGSVDLYVVVNVLSGLPVSAALLSLSIWYGARSLGRDAPGPGPCGALPPNVEP
jgi:hypothetical protein